MRARWRLIRTAITGALILAGWIAGRMSAAWPLPYALGLRAASDGLMIAAAGLGGFEVVFSAFRALRMGVLSIQALVTVAAAGALAIGEYWEAAVLLFLFSGGGYLEALTVEKTRRAIQSLVEASPKTARVRRGDPPNETVIPADEVLPPETVIVLSGERIPVDGTVISGSVSVNEAPVTGEPIPKEKGPGDPVFAGTVVQVGYAEIRSERVGEDSTFGRIIRLVEEAQEEKAPVQRTVERFAKYYTPAIIASSAAVFLLTSDLRVALTFLVIACPGALVISTPISVVAAIGNAARNGILIKGGSHLETAGLVTTVAFDKTGTLTLGRPEVTSVVSFYDEFDKKDILRLAALAEQFSEHHIASAVMRKASELGLAEEIGAARQRLEFEVSPGRGVAVTPLLDIPATAEDNIARVVIASGESVVVGTPLFLRERGVRDTARLAYGSVGEPSRQDPRNLVATTIYVGSTERGLLGAISLTDPARPEAPEAVDLLRRAGIRRILILTGDASEPASAVAEGLGITEVRAGLLPDQKLKTIKDLRAEGEVVAMVGDGINDAPALASSDLGIAMGAAGTDTAMETADIVLMSDDLRRVAHAIALSRAARANVLQNLSISLIVVFLLVLGVLTRHVFMASGMLIHQLSVLTVLLNASRLLRHKYPLGLTEPAGKLYR
ncbi:MAG TPA: cation-translocating P-type ATPase [Clostridia bacterium]|nr:cation-translocating P-type ATPase [Clostridia bacterium]